MLVLCLTGMPGSGKSVVASLAKELGVPVYVMGDVVREEAKLRGLPLTPSNLNKVAKELRREYGEDVIARRLVERIRASSKGSRVVLVDGVRSLQELHVLKELGRVVVIAVHASPRTRFERVRKRGRQGDPRTWEEFCHRDMVELEFGVGDVIALADLMLVNEGSIESLRRSALKLIRGLVENAAEESQS